MRTMHCVAPEDLDTYLQADRIGSLLREWERAGDDAFTIHRWLRDTPSKRMIFDEMYGDLLFGRGERLRILDVGGGVSALTRLLARRHDYRLIDIFAHDDPSLMRSMRDEIGRVFWTEGDWYKVWPDGLFDVIIANDLFPNADQRLGAFLERALARCAELRISLTFYNELKFYVARRVDAEEILYVQGYNGEQTAAVLSRFVDRIEMPALDELLRVDRQSLYQNGRQVAIACLRGDAYGSRSADNSGDTKNVSGA
jgi:hypothetical protein